MKITELLKEFKTVGITGHIRPDGDCTGSTLGLYNYIVENYPDKDVDIYLEQPGEEFNYLKNFDKINNTPTEKKYDLFIVLDSSSKDRILPFSNCFDNALHTCCIDHHISNEMYAEQNFVAPKASSASEVVCEMMDDELISKSVAECIYTGIVHDTGVFKYSCTSGKTMKMAGMLMDKGIDYSDIIDNSFYKKTYIQNQLLGRALLESVLLFEGKCIFSVISKETMDFYGINGSALGGIVEQLRLTDGVEVAIFLYENEDGSYKVSLRSKKYVDVSIISVKFGGGGHQRAAGFTAFGNVHQIINSIGVEIEKQLGQE